MNALKAGVGKVPTIKELKGPYSLSDLKKEFTSYTLLKGEEILMTGTTGKKALQCDFNSIRLEDKTPDLERQKIILRALQSWLPLSNDKPHTLSLPGCAVLTSQELLPFLHPGLAVLNLTGSSIESIPPQISECPLEELVLTACENLTYLENREWKGLFQGTEVTPLKLPYLKKLHINRCPQLLSIHLDNEQDLLKELKISNNPKLTTTSLKIDLLTPLDLKGTPPQNLETIITAKLVTAIFSILPILTF